MSAVKFPIKSDVNWEFFIVIYRKFEGELPIRKYPILFGFWTLSNVISVTKRLIRKRFFNAIEIIHKYGSTEKKSNGMIYVSEILHVFKVRIGAKSRERYRTN